MGASHVARPVVVGSGYIAARHAAALRELGIAVGGVFSPNRANATRFADTWGGEASGSLEELLQVAGATHVHVCSTTMHHEAAVLAAATAGLTVVCEKPLGPDLPTARRLAAAVAERGVGAYLTFNRRFDAGVQLLREHVAAGELGEPVAVYGSYQQQWNAEPSSRDWRFDPAQVGPSRVVSEIGSHWLDLVEHILGRPLRRVSGLLHTMGEREFTHGGATGRFTPPNEDLMSAQLRYEGDVVGQVLATQLAHGAWDDITVRVDGTLQSAWWDSGTPNQLHVAHKLRGHRILGLASETTSIQSAIREIYRPAGGERICATFDDGVRNCASMDAILRSALTNEWTEVEKA
ncbi:MAG: Oxidoreductase, NAD-binding domain protein [Streptosporangiaceae bacterium]|nr:Oxidoreductase, NAD-binding domain protein [Streptosporangiaceae bacterium]